MKLIDTHAHLDFPEFDQNRSEVIKRAKDAGVGIVSCSLSRDSWEKVKDIKGIYFTIGCTPYHLEDFKGQYNLIEENTDKILAVGEIGLDYYWLKEDDKREQEKENFIKLLRLAKKYDKPVIIHSRNAESPALDILESEKIPKAIMHCFSGSKRDAERAIDLGYLISIPTNISRSKQKQKFAKQLPLESLVLETDAPYLGPELDMINEPANIVQSAHKIADLCGLGYEEVAKQTTRNAKEFFKI
jgi:TatD DNase family protein